MGGIGSKENTNSGIISRGNSGSRGGHSTGSPGTKKSGKPTTGSAESPLPIGLANAAPEESVIETKRNKQRTSMGHFLLQKQARITPTTRAHSILVFKNKVCNFRA